MYALEELRLSADWDKFARFRGSRFVGFPTGIDCIDRSLKGLYDLVCIQGEPGSYKSTFALQIALHNAANRVPILIIDRESGQFRLKSRLLCMANQIPMREVLTCSEEQLEEYISAVNELPIYAMTETPRSFDQIEQLIAQIIDESNGPMILVVDSLQAMPRFGMDERGAIETWMNFLDQLKLNYENKFCAIVTSEKARSAYQQSQEGNQTKTYGAKGSNSPEYKSAILLDLLVSHTKQKLYLKVIKNRDGAPGLTRTLQKRLLDPTDPESFTFTLENGYEPEE